MVGHSEKPGGMLVEFKGINTYKYGSIQAYKAKLSIEQTYRDRDYGDIVDVRDLLYHIASYCFLAACAALLIWLFGPDWWQDRVVGLFIACSVLISVFMVANLFIGSVIFRHRVAIAGVLDKVIFGALGLYMAAIIYFRVIAVAF